MELKLVSVSWRSIVFRIGAESAASVNTNASIVAMSGAIMPEPLAIPAMRTSTSPILQVAPAPFGNVSVVIIAAAAAGQLTGASSIFGSAAAILESSSTTPITPVDAESISRTSTPSVSAAASSERLHAASPAGPVKELAQPAFTSSPREPPRVAESACLHQSVGAEPTALEVKTPAAFVPLAQRMSSRSGRSCL